jgi:Fe-S cluster biogenesis protein NfuA
MIEVKQPIVIYAESTPNPSSLKFVANIFLLQSGSVEYLSKEEAKNSPLASQLFDFSGVSSVFIAGNFVTITKQPGIEWYEITNILREFIKGFLESGEKIFIGEKGQKADASIERTQTASAVESKIVEALEEYVRPAVEQDGGAIHFKSFENGIVTLILKGSCSGCPSSVITLKSGIENLLKQLIPEVHEVIAEAQ